MDAVHSTTVELISDSLRTGRDTHPMGPALIQITTNRQPVARKEPLQNAEKWIFGFGSIIHNQGFEWSRRVDGFIQGYRRVFYQGSTDHRGVPGAPGRTATLIHDISAVTWGSAFCLMGSPVEQAATLEYLEYREKQYDVRELVDIYSAIGDTEPAVVGALLYIASDDRARNGNWLGPAPLQDLSAQIARARGPSGPNHEYLFKLADALRQMGVADAELFELEAAVQTHLKNVEHSAAEGNGSGVL